MKSTMKQVPDEIEVLRAEIEAPGREMAEKQARLAQLEDQRAALREAAGHEEAAKRILGVRRGNGSHVSRLDQLHERETQLVEQLVALRTERRVITTKRGLLALEADALVHRFGVEPAFPEPIHLFLARLVVDDVPIPEQEQPRFPRAKIEQDAHGLRERRSYAEVTGTDAANIIADAGGPLPFPPLTAAQEQMVAERARERRVDPVAAALADEVAALPPTVAYATARVHRG